MTISSRLSPPAGRRPRPPPARRPPPSRGEPVPLIGGCTPLTFPQMENNSSTYVELTPRGDTDASSFDPASWTSGGREQCWRWSPLALMTVVSAVSGLNVALPTWPARPAPARPSSPGSSTPTPSSSRAAPVRRRARRPLRPQGVLLIAGLAVFGVAAGLAMVTNDPGQLIAAAGADGRRAPPRSCRPRCRSSPRRSRPRSAPQAIGVWVGVAGGGAVLGLFGTGILLEFFSWSSFFGLNVDPRRARPGRAPSLVVPELGRPGRPRLDVVGAVLSLVAVSATVFGDHRGPRPRLERPADRSRRSSPASSRCVAFVRVGAARRHSRCSTRGCSGSAASAPAR